VSCDGSVRPEQVAVAGTIVSLFFVWGERNLAKKKKKVKRKD
jgi:hypothetical protein